MEIPSFDKSKIKTILKNKTDKIINKWKTQQIKKTQILI